MPERLRFRYAEATTELPKPDVLSMYQIPGSDPVTRETFLRYEEDRKKNSLGIELEAMRVHSSEWYKRKIENFFVDLRREEKKEERKYQQQKNKTNQKRKRSMKEEELLENLMTHIDKGINSDDAETQYYCVEFIKRLPEDVEDLDLLYEKASRRIWKGLQEQDEKKQLYWAKLIEDLMPEHAPYLIGAGLRSPYVSVRAECAGSIQHAPNKDQLELARKVFVRKEDVVAQMACLKEIYYYPEPFKTTITEQGINVIQRTLVYSQQDVDPSAWLACAKTIPYLSETVRPVLYKQVSELVEQLLASTDSEQAALAASLVYFVQKSDQDVFVKELYSRCNNGLNAHNLAEGLAATRIISHLSDSTGIELAIKGFNSAYKEVQVACASFPFPAARPKELIEYICAGLATNFPEVQRLCAVKIWRCPSTERAKLFELAQKVLGDQIIEPIIYLQKPVSDDVFQRIEFNKTGSGLTVVGGSLKGKSVIRHIYPEAFLAWQTVFEDYKTWQTAGFEYVPIEPIQSYRLNEKEHRVDVFSGVLDTSLANWQSMGGPFGNELVHDSERILDVLKHLDVSHGHPNEGNFCLRFFRHPDGTVDFSKKPRIYLIDFDRAYQT